MGEIAAEGERSLPNTEGIGLIKFPVPGMNSSMQHTQTGELCRRGSGSCAELQAAHLNSNKGKLQRDYVN